jgi:hypothetical protein
MRTFFERQTQEADTSIVYKRVLEIFSRYLSA